MKITAIILAAVTSAAFAQGPLTPPPGADPSIGPVNALTPGGLPQGTMKTLNQVEPRTAIPGGTSTVTLSQSGSYFLTGNIAVSTGNGLSITASNVTLDLNGFSVSSSAAPAEGTAIALASVVNVTLRNGNLGGGFAGGVRHVQESGPPSPPFNVRIADLSISYVTEVGISMAEGQVERCMVFCSAPTALGIDAWSVKDCRVRGGNLSGVIVKDCFVSNGAASGIYAQVVVNSVANTAGNAITAKTLTNSCGTGGGSNDVIIAGVAQNVWAEGGSGTGDGIEATVASNVVGRRVNDLGGASTGTGIRAAILQNAEASSPGNAIDGKCVINAMGTGGGDNDVIAAGVAQNVWAEGGSGTGDGIEATVAGNSYGKRVNDLGGTSTGAAIKSKVVQAAFGSGAIGVGIDGDVVCGVRAENNSDRSNRPAIRGSVVVSSSGNSQFGTAIKAISGGVISQSRGQGHVNSLLADQGVITGSNGTGGDDAISGPDTLVANSRGSTQTGWGIDATAVIGSYGDGLQNGIISHLSSGNYGVSSTGTGVAGYLVHSSFGIARTPTNSYNEPELKFDSN